MYLAVLPVLLLSFTFNNSGWIREQNSEVFKDFNGNEIDLKICDVKTCVLKCCGYKEALDDTSECVNDVHGYTKESAMGLFIWNRTTGGLNLLEKRFDDNVILLQNRRYTNGLLNDMWEYDFEINQDGSLEVKSNGFMNKNLTMPRLQFCVDYNVDVMYKDRAKLVFKLSEENTMTARTLMKAKFIATGLMASAFWLFLVVFYLLPQPKPFKGLIMVAKIISLLAIYILEAFQIVAPSYRLNGLTQCKVMSPALYFFILSNFFWVAASTYNVFIKIRKARVVSTSKKEVSDRVKFIWYSLCCWGIPFVMTTLTLIVELLVNAKVLSVQQPPFDSCFANEMSTLLYLHIPIIVLICICGILSALSVYNVLMVTRIAQNPAITKNPIVVDKSKLDFTKPRIALFGKLVFIVGMFLITHFIPVPTTIYFALNIYNVYALMAIIAVVIGEKYLFIKPCQRFFTDKWIITKFQELSKTAATKLGTGATNIKFERMNDSKEFNINRTADIV